MNYGWLVTVKQVNLSKLVIPGLTGNPVENQWIPAIAGMTRLLLCFLVFRCD